MSAIDFIKQVEDPTLMWWASATASVPPRNPTSSGTRSRLGVKTQMVVYPNEGHIFHDPAHQRDVLLQTIAWFQAQMPPK